MNKFVKSMDDFFDLISEAFDNPLPIKWIKNGNILRGLFTVSNNIYQIVCKDSDSNIWKYDFYFYGENKNFSTELTGLEKDKFRVLPTVEYGINYLYDNNNVDAIVFGASDKSKGRKKLYNSFCEKFCSNKGLDFYTRTYNDKDVDRQIFILYKKDINKEILSNTILKILEEEKFGIR